MTELPEEIADFINSFYIFSKLNKKGYEKFNYIICMFNNENNEDLKKTVFTSSLCDEDKEILLALANKNASDLINQINNRSKDISYPKPKQIKDGYFKSFEQQLLASKSDLDFFAKKYNLSYILIFYSGETIKYIYKVRQNLIAEYHSYIDFFLLQLRSILFGTNLDELIEASMYEEGSNFASDLIDNIEEQDDKDNRPIFLDKDDDEFNNY